MVMDVLTGFPERLRPGKLVFLGDEHTPVTLASLRGHKAQEMIVRLAGVETPEAAGQYRNRLLFVRADELPDLPEGEYYHHQLIGLAILGESGERLGVLADILETGANDVYVLKTPDEKEVLLPAVEEVILEVNLERREMRVRLPDWQ
jgi:16S rRNA processing protein RimM